jgi:histidinol-phosphate aminotransferase
MIKPLESVKQIKPYVPGKPIKELERELGISGCIKLASNENPAGPSPLAVAAINKFMAESSELSRYPDGSSYYLKQALAEKHSGGGVKVEPSNLIIGNGSNELLDMAARTYVGPGDEAVMSANSFVVYAMSVQSIGGVAKVIDMKDYTHDLAAMADAITAKTKIVFVANPNNPTGTINRRDEFDAFMKRVPDGVLVVMDEAYLEYATDPGYPDTLGTHFAEGRDILVLRTFSKAYGLAALRIGYGIAKDEIIEDMNRIREPFNNNTLAQEAALAALRDEEHLRLSVAMNEEGKQYLYSELSALGIKYVPTQANFIFMPLDRDAAPLYEALLHKAVIVRPVGPKEIRVTIGTDMENRRFIRVLKMCLG